jgi:hypothetical protein
MKVNITVVATKTFTAGRLAISVDDDIHPRPKDAKREIYHIREDSKGGPGAG